MKKIRPLQLFLIITILANFFNCSRTNINYRNKDTVEANAKLLVQNIYPNFLSNNAKIFINDLSQRYNICSIYKNWKADNYLLSNYPLEILNDSIYYIKGMIEVNTRFNIKCLDDLGIYHTKDKKNIFTVSIPVYTICEFVKLNNIERFELARKGELSLNIGRPAINAQNLVFSQFNNMPIQRNQLTGNGVVIGIIDYGFDYTHPNFYDYSGTNYRVKKVWQQTDNNGIPPKGFNYGSELSTMEEIISANCDTRVETHGTVVTGIASGSGVNTSFYGIAPNSELIFVSTTLTDVAIADGLRYISNYTETTGKPCVINLSIGSTIGPHDGTSAFDRLCDSISKPGLVFTGAVGNNGDNNVYMSNIFGKNSSDTIIQSVIVPTTSSLAQIIDLWGSENSDFSVGVGLIDSISKQVLVTSAYLNVNEMRDKVHTFKLEFDTLFYIAQISCEYSKYNNKPSAMIQFTASTPGIGILPLIRISSNESMKIEGWSSQSVFSNLGLQRPFISGNTTHTISEIGGTGKSILSVGAFCTKNSWVSYLGDSYDYGPLAVIGDIAFFSSKGPTSDGRIKPDVVCPGYGVVSSYNNFFDASYPPDYYKTFSVPFNNIQYFFGILQGTSIATPFLTGVIALMLEKNDSLSFDMIKNAIIKTAASSPLSVTPNNVWGWGIVNAGEGVAEIK